MKSSLQETAKSEVPAPVTARDDSNVRLNGVVYNSAKECPKPRPDCHPLQDQSSHPCADLPSRDRHGASAQSSIEAGESSSGLATEQRSGDGIDAALRKLLKLLLQ